MTRTPLALVILLTLASCTDGGPAAGTFPDDAAAADALARGEALGSDAGAELAPDSGAAAETSPSATGGAGGGRDAGGSGGAGGASPGTGGATSTGGAGGGAAAYPTCMAPAGGAIESLVCRKLVGDVYRATRRDGFICTTACLAVTADGRPAGYQGGPSHPECVYATSAGQVPMYLCLGSCQGCQP